MFATFLVGILYISFYEMIQAAGYTTLHDHLARYSNVVLVISMIISSAFFGAKHGTEIGRSMTAEE